MKVEIRLAGDRALVVELGDEISPLVNARVRAFCDALEARRVPGIVELVPTYRSVAVHYRPEEIARIVLEGEILAAAERAGAIGPQPARLVEIPVIYDGPDLDFVAAHAGLSVGEVVRIHSAAEYLVHMLGFTPGFPYLGGMDAKIATPRLEKPRVRIPAGSVGIAGAQTGVYPIDSPGGWRLIGRTPRKLYDPAREKPFLLDAGDRVRFVPIGEGEA
jgi:KipI family sensor histidine kinase inhibitor